MVGCGTVEIRQGKVWNNSSYCLSGSKSGCGTVGHTVGQAVQGRVWNSRSYCLGSKSGCGTVGHTVGQAVQGRVWNSRSYCLGSRSYGRVGSSCWSGRTAG